MESAVLNETGRALTAHPKYLADCEYYFLIISIFLSRTVELQKQKNKDIFFFPMSNKKLFEVI